MIVVLLIVISILAIAYSLSQAQRLDDDDPRF